MTITLKDLSIGYRQRGNSKVVASGLSASVEAGCLTCLIGENGVGKSTLLRTLAGFQPPLSGSVLIDGRDITHCSSRELARQVSVVLTTKLDLMNMTVSEVVSLGRTPYTGFWGTLREDDRLVVERSLSMVGIGGLATRMISTLSDGERQKAMIAKALAQMTPVIILDEPTAYLDYPSKVETMRLLKRLSHETRKTVFLSTHDLDIALQAADTLWLMTPSEPLTVGAPADLAASGALQRFIDRPGLHFQSASMKIIVE